MGYSVDGMVDNDLPSLHIASDSMLVDLLGRLVTEHLHNMVVLETVVGIMVVTAVEPYTGAVLDTVTVELGIGVQSSVVAVVPFM